MFRNYDKLISAAALANPKNNFLVRFRNKVTDPTPYYLSKLKSKTLSDCPFEVSILATHLLRKTEADIALLNSIKSKESDHINFQRKLGHDIETDAGIISDYVDHLKKLISIDSSNTPIQIFINTVYVFEKTNKSDKSFYEKTLFPELKKKLKYASYANLADLTDALVHGKNFGDKALWTSILEGLAAKSSEIQAQNVEYSAWDLDKYEPEDKTGRKCEYLTENQKYYRDLEIGGEWAAEIAHEFRKASDYFMCTWFQWLFFNEKRIGSKQNLTEEKVDLERLVRNLETVGKSVPELNSAVQKITHNIQGN
mmetsp:Transcript_9375/g.10549  ORF Transcript_9375/g.10549 Transcript_9375/m.10549 type:complete len:311 (-) Transcript_9375:163-1095(-)|eukprot:CAMPEP_0176424640 /NCGR_PEP_ID=MMETSP0127-20121128/10945_1 /TAXON_ID=938130 /ORGANISM="Platyophrya macrostoma, Strain WH" /LENGTH=310 /DNA_ID=CAMNT_0017805711 /DNA_START=23 /DNA_END=955 /DNA_ORIENTATION=+